MILKVTTTKEFVIHSSMDAYDICVKFADTKEVRDQIKNSVCAFLYCTRIKDREDMRNKIVETKWKEKYLEWKSNR